jgi:nucleotide-binding universal stress UspA family protein
MAEADELLDESAAIVSGYGVRVVERVVRARHAGRAIVDEAARRGSDIIVLGTPRRAHRAIFGHTVDYVLKHAPCRVMIAAGRKAA